MKTRLIAAAALVAVGLLVVGSSVATTTDRSGPPDTTRTVVLSPGEKKYLDYVAGTLAVRAPDDEAAALEAGWAVCKSLETESYDDVVADALEENYWVGSVVVAGATSWLCVS